MGRPYVLAILGTLIAGVAVAQVRVPGPTPAERLSEFRRNLHLLEALVDSGVRLAGETDPLKRAESCNALAGRLSKEIQLAAAAREGVRAADLGACLQDLLVRGVASNLDLAHSRLPPDAPPTPEAKRLGQRVIEVTKSMEEELERSSVEGEQVHMKAAMKAVSKGRAEVEKAAKGKSRTQHQKHHTPRK